MDYENLPVSQHALQRLVDQFNRDERVWQKLGRRRRLRRKLMSWLSEEEHQALDELEFSRTRPLDDCIGSDLARVHGSRGATALGPRMGAWVHGRSSTRNA